MDRRNFVRDLALSAGALAALPSLPAFGGSEANPSVAAPADPKPDPLPTAAQKAWMELRFGMFVHFGINTYYDKEWSDGSLSPEKYNPSKLDPEVWCAAAKAAGMKYLVLVTKHHDGFCNWPTKETEYCVRATPYKKDVVGQVVTAARNAGLQIGFYYSLWDRNNKLHDSDEMAYAEFMKRQLTELLTGYGPIAEVWFDGMWKKQTTGWKAKEDPNTPEAQQKMMRAWRDEGAYRWQMDGLYALIKKLQPDCLVINNATTSYPGMPLFPCDIRSGERATDTSADRKVWEFAGKQRYLPLQMETTMSTGGKDPMFASGNWFWHADDKTVASADTVRTWLKQAEKMGANLLLNCGPSPEGQLREQDLALLRSLT